MKLLNSICLLLLLAGKAQAIDLVGMQEMALGNREIIQKFATRLEQSDEDVVFARGAYYPSVDIGYTGNTLDEASAVEPSENSSIFGEISYSVFAGFRDKYTLQSTEFRRTAEEHRLDAIRQDVQLAVALAYLQVFERRANRRVAESAFKTLEKLYRDGESRYKVGLIGKNDLLKFRVDYDNADITLKAAEGGLDKSIISLSRQVGDKIVFADLDFVDFKELPGEIDKKAYLATMLNERSEIKVLEAGIDASTALSEARLGEYYPQVDVVGRYQRYDDDIINGSGDLVDDELRALLQLRMNLFKGYRTEAAVAKARLETRALSYDLQELKDDLTEELENIYIEYEISRENVVVAKRSIEQAEENLRITKLKYDEGLERESDLLDAITNLSRAQYNYVAVVRTVFLNRFRLTRMVNGFTAFSENL